MKTQGPVLDFGEDAESALLGTQTVKLVVADLRVEGEAEIKLDLAPVPGVYLHCVFKDPRLLIGMMSAMTEPESLTLCLIRSDQLIEGISSRKQVERGWHCESSNGGYLAEPVKVVGDEATPK